VFETVSGSFSRGPTKPHELIVCTYGVHYKSIVFSLTKYALVYCTKIWSTAFYLVGDFSSITVVEDNVACGDVK